jgi:hypothetical protein
VFDCLRGLLILGGIAAGLAGVATIVRAMTLQKDNPLAFAVGEALSGFLDNRYTYLRNVSKRSVGYIDAVLLGPPGALVFRIVDHPGAWRNERAEWIVKAGGRHRPARQNPTRECVKDVYALRKFLGKRGLEHVPVYAIVVFTSPNLELSAADPVVPICEVPTLFRVLSREYLVDERITPPIIRNAVDAIIEG